MERGVPRCSFCRRTQGEVRLVAGPSDVYICNLCVALCGEILAHGAPPERTEPPPERSGRGPLIVTEVTSG